MIALSVLRHNLFFRLSLLGVDRPKPGVNAPGFFMSSMLDRGAKAG
jgi:hypothetical protein